MASPEYAREVVGLLQDLISIESHSDIGGREAAIGRYLVDWFRERGIDAERLIVDADDDRANIVARIPGGAGPSLMLNGHLDTVPAGDMVDAFSLRQVGDELWGRGACDMKGAIAGMACAMASCTRDATAERLVGDLLFTGTVGEETGSMGVKALVDDGILTTYAVVGEPTSLRMGVAHKGACFIRISLTGRGAHGSRPDLGINAVSYAAKLVELLETEFRITLADRLHPLLGPSTVSVGRIHGGSQPNIVAEHCYVDIDRRTLPDEIGALEEIRSLVSAACDPIEGLGWVVEELPETSIVPHGALEISKDSPLVEGVQAALRTHGWCDAPVGVTYWTDGGHLASSGIETLIFGPGDIAHAHGPEDRVLLSELTASVDLYESIIRQLLVAD